MALRVRIRRLVAWGALALVPLSGGRAGAAPSLSDDLEIMAQRMIDLEAQVRELDITLKSETPNSETVERRIIDGQVLYELKNYEAASIILLDVVDRHPNDRGWPEALFFLADSLYLKRDFLSARRYFEKAVALGPGSRHYGDSLQRLIELSLHIGDYAKIDEYISKLGGIGRTNDPNIAYVEGKYLFFRKRYDESIARLQAIQKGQKNWFQAQYFIGASRVQQGRPGEAAQLFDALAKSDATNENEKKILELTHMALGRIYYDQAQIQSANAEYDKIQQGSDLYSDALYEIGWVAVKDKQYAKAYRKFDLLLTNSPEGPQAPEIRLLMGNLQVRQGLWDDATRSFTATRDQFEVIKNEFDTAMKKQGDSEKFFRELLANNLGKFDLASYVPPSASKWISKDAEVEQLAGLIGDETELRKSLDEAADLVDKLEKAIASPQRVNIFPELAGARTRAVATANRLLDLENQLVQKEHDLVVATASTDERKRLELATKARRELQQRLQALPKAKESYEERMRKAKGDYDLLDKRVVELNVLLSNLVAERVAIEKYVADTHQADNPDARAAFMKQLDEVKRAEAEITGAYDQLRREIGEQEAAIGVDDAQMAAEEELKKQLAAAISAEQAEMGQLRERLTGPDAARAVRAEELLGRARGAESQIAQFNTRIDGLIESKLSDVRVTIADEKAHIGEYQKQLASYRGETNVVGGGVTAQSLRNIADRFYQIVVRADVGIIDVAWAIKDKATQENARLVREKKRELKLLDDEFKEVLKE